MNTHYSLSLAFCIVIANSAHGVDGSKLEPNATVRLDFPDLPDTLATMSSGEKQPARLTATLPTNYTREGKFPVFVFLNGGDGGRGDSLPVSRRQVVPRDFICASLPLFKRTYTTNDGGLVSMDDFQTVSRCYRAMLQKLFDEVPNVTPERSALGGFSNGAHTVGVLLAGQDEFVLSRFRAFYFVERGFGPLAANALRKTAMKPCRFLLLRGDKADDDSAESKAEREHNTHLAQALELEAQEHHLNFTSIIMRGHGHELPSEYITLLGQWVRGEKLSDSEKR